MDYLSFIQSKVIRQKEELANTLSIWRFKGEKIVFTNGCFDLLHRGHVEYLAKAAALGTKLVIGLNTDASVGAYPLHTTGPVGQRQRLPTRGYCGIRYCQSKRGRGHHHSFDRRIFHHRFTGQNTTLITYFRNQRRPLKREGVF